MVLGMAVSSRVPAVRWPTLRPGSGRLAVKLCADGPTRRVRIVDSAEQVPCVMCLCHVGATSRL